MRFGFAEIFPGAAVLQGLGIALCSLLALWLLYSVMGLTWLLMLRKQNGSAALPEIAADRSIELLVSSTQLSSEASLLDLRMSALDFYVIHNPTVSGSLGQVVQCQCDADKSVNSSKSEDLRLDVSSRTCAATSRSEAEGETFLGCQGFNGDVEPYTCKEAYRQSQSDPDSSPEMGIAGLTEDVSALHHFALAQQAASAKHAGTNDREAADAGVGGVVRERDEVREEGRDRNDLHH
jgi:hypothetical protein